MQVQLLTSLWRETLTSAETTGRSEIFWSSGSGMAQTSA
jgi:hypothetical protein